jgi:thiamine kinase
MTSMPALELRDEALACVPGWEPGAKTLEIAPLAGGTANCAYRVRTRLGEFVLRLHEPQSTLLGVNRTSELALHAAAARAGIAPPLVGVDPAGRFLITEYSHGSPWRADDMADATHLQRLAGRLQQLHTLPAPSVASYEPARLLRAHAERVSQADPTAAPLLMPWVHRAEGILEDCALAGRRPSIIHNDLHHSNILQAGSQIYLIDWEYAAVADPLFDLACLLAYYPAAAPHAQLLLDEIGLPGTALTPLYEVAWLYMLLSYLWYRVLALQAAPSAAAQAQERELLRHLTEGQVRRR